MADLLTSGVTKGHRRDGKDGVREGSVDFGVFDDAKTYYTSDARHGDRLNKRNRTLSQVCCTMYYLIQ